MDWDRLCNSRGLHVRKYPGRRQRTLFLTAEKETENRPRPLKKSG